jgi:hypothetical protein
MSTIDVLPGLVLRDWLFEAAADAVTRFAPHLPPLTYAVFTDPARWWCVPDDEDEMYKAELLLPLPVLAAEPEGTADKFNVWFKRDDRRRDGKPWPHDHRNGLYCYRVAGAYREDRYRLAADGTITAQLGVIHTAGGLNKIAWDDLHEIPELLDEPGAVASLMLVDRTRPSRNWGHLDLDTGLRHEATAPDPRFTAALRRLNPHQPAPA